ncbi:MAG: trigger factor [Pseudomonadota bacterium]|uniref:trigger factor n=1 Tax=Thermithiobacillus tepidarius TaxID=929 RepID=UPI0004213C02|nr:trigger factor [Thermithiobacillus tepidarius]
MQVSVEAGGPLEKRLKVTVPAEEVESTVSSRLRRLASTVRMPGFRPGKVPMRLVEQRYGDQVLIEAYDELINRTYSSAIAEQGLRPVGQPDIAIEASGRGQDFSYSATIEIYPEFEPALGEGELKRPTAEVGDEDVERTIQALREQRRTYETVDRPAALNDQVIIDFKGFIGDEAFPGGEAQGFNLVLGSKRTIEGFEEGIVGAVAGETRSVEVAFPEDYGNKELAGKQARFEIKVQAVMEPRLPEVNDEFAKSLGVEEGGVDALRQEVRENLAFEAERASRARMKSQVLDMLADANPIDVPRKLLDAEMQRLRETLGSQGQQQEPSAEADGKLEELARRRVILGLVISELVRRNDLQPDRDAVRQELERIASQYQNPDQVVAWYLGNPERLGEIEAMVLENKVVDWVLARAKVKEEAVTFNQLIGRDEVA